MNDQVRTAGKVQESYSPMRVAAQADDDVQPDFVAGAPAPVKPVWDGEERELTLGGKLVKRYCQSAEKQIPILEAFQKAGWARSIANPLTDDPDLEGKQLHDTIQDLNRFQKEGRVHFGGDGTGSRIRWWIEE
jgi:hypothetical protein